MIEGLIEALGPDDEDNTDQLEEVDPVELDLNDIDLEVEGFEGYPEEDENDDSSSNSSGPQG